MTNAYDSFPHSDSRHYWYQNLPNLFSRGHATTPCRVSWSIHPSIHQFVQNISKLARRLCITTPAQPSAIRSPCINVKASVNQCTSIDLIELSLAITSNVSLPSLRFVSPMRAMVTNLIFTSLSRGLWLTMKNRCLSHEVYG